MPGQIVRSKIAALASEAIGSRQCREILREHGWSEGMPIIVAQHDEKLGDVMALAAAHKPPVLVATLDPESENICFTYVAIGCSDLEIVAVRGTDDSIIDLYRESRLRPCITFRVAPLLHSAIAHALPPLHKATGARYPALAVDHTEGGR